jgi:hypothetical protein
VTHADRWWDTFNAVVSGHTAGRQLNATEAITFATEVADEAHGELGDTRLARFERDVARVTEVVNSPEATPLALDDEGDRQALLKLLSAALGES